MPGSGGTFRLVDTLEHPAVESRRVTWYEAETTRPRWSPRDRPPASGRVFVGLLAFAAMLVTAALLLSDRAPGLLTSMFGDRARRLWERIDGDEQLGSAAGTELTSTDFVAHLAIWAVVTVLVGIALWTWRGLVVGVVALTAASLLLEAAQGKYASTRTVQAIDAVANLVGIALGAMAAGACYLAWSAGAAAIRRFRPRRAGTDLPVGAARSLR